MLSPPHTPSGCFASSGQGGLCAMAMSFQPHWGRRPQLTVNNFHVRSPFRCSFPPTRSAPGQKVNSERRLTGWRECELGLCLLIKPILARATLPDPSPEALSPRPPSSFPPSTLATWNQSRQPVGAVTASSRRLTRVSLCSRQKRDEDGCEETERPEPHILRSTAHVFPCSARRPRSMRLDARKKT